jgi:putative heme-binding domain-containing protein
VFTLPILLFGAFSYAEDSLDSLDKNDITIGEQRFNAHCAICHSVGGTGGRGPDLTIQPFLHAPTDSDLIRIIQRGIRGTEMPGNYMLNDREVRQTAAYVRSLARVEQEELPGDPKRGATVYDSQNCAACHIVDGQGQGIGPELTDIGRQRSLAHLRVAIVRPEDDVRDEYRLVRATTVDGTVIEGLRINEDNFSIQLRDIEGNLHSFRKTDLRSLRKLFGRSLMFEYASRLDPADVDDLVAYMASLKGEQ